jgi:hypothetical protein
VNICERQTTDNSGNNFGGKIEVSKYKDECMYQQLSLSCTNPLHATGEELKISDLARDLQSRRTKQLWIFVNGRQLTTVEITLAAKSKWASTKMSACTNNCLSRVPTDTRPLIYSQGRHCIAYPTHYVICIDAIPRFIENAVPAFIEHTTLIIYEWLRWQALEAGKGINWYFFSVSPEDTHAQQLDTKGINAVKYQMTVDRDRQLFLKKDGLFGRYYDWW